jgi:hypothetical protein
LIAQSEEKTPATRKRFAFTRIRTERVAPVRIKERRDKKTATRMGGCFFGSGDPIRTDDRSGMKGRIANAEKRGKYAKNA